jgi:hypothetical protein
MPQSSENLYHSLQLVRKEVDGSLILAGHEQILGREFDMESQERPGPLLMFRFNPRDSATLIAGLAAFSEMFQQLPKDKRVVFIAPGSEKFGDLGRQAVSEFSRSTGQDHKLFVLDKSSDNPNDHEDGYDGHVQDYVPVTAPRDETRYLAMSREQEEEIRQEIENGAIVVVIDDILSTGKTFEAIEELIKKIGVPVHSRFAVGAEKRARLIDIDGDQLIWEANDGDDEPKLEVKTAFVLPLFEGNDVIKIIERSE